MSNTLHLINKRNDNKKHEEGMKKVLGVKEEEGKDGDRMKRDCMRESRRLEHRGQSDEEKLQHGSK